MNTFHPDFLPHWNTWGYKMAICEAIRATADKFLQEDLVQEATITVSRILTECRFDKDITSYARRAIRGNNNAYVCQRKVVHTTDHVKSPEISYLLPGDEIPLRDTSCSEVPDYWDKIRDSVTEKQYTVLQSRYREGLSLRETADVLGIRHGSVSTAQDGAVRRIQKRWRKEGIL